MRIEILANRNKSQNVRGPIFNSRGAGLIGDLIPGPRHLLYSWKQAIWGRLGWGSYFQDIPFITSLFHLVGKIAKGVFYWGDAIFMRLGGAINQKLAIQEMFQD